MKKIILILICVLAYSTANACNNHGDHKHSYYSIEANGFHPAKEEILKFDDGITFYEDELEDESFSQDI